VNKQLFDELVGSVKEAGKIKRGQKKAARTTHVAQPDVRKIRKKAGLSQSQFARMIHVSPKTLQNWEQKRRQPNGPAIALLKVVDSDPEFVLRALHAQRRAA
jgi:putative transcriptional regulator